MENRDLFYSDVGKLIRLARRSKDFNQEELAEKTGLSRVSVVNIEKGKQTISLHVLLDISIALDTSLERLIPPEVGIRDKLKLDYSQVKEELDTPEAKRVGKLFFEDDNSN